MPVHKAWYLSDATGFLLVKKMEDGLRRPPCCREGVPEDGIGGRRDGTDSLDGRAGEVRERKYIAECLSGSETYR